MEAQPPLHTNYREGLRDLRFHPDGWRIAFYSERSQDEIWVMENFLPALKTGR
ncbi:MAG: hypothetical protein ACRDGM_01735 [bacterium]